MGEVYRATDSKLGREVAIKLIPEDFARDAMRMARFTREAQVLASLNHPNIAAIYGVEDRALIMELVEGPTLSERIKRGAVPLDEALDIARQIADGLEAAHEKGIVHRDLKPANIKITPSGTVKLLDFGLAKAEGPWSDSVVGRGCADADGGEHGRGSDSRHGRLHGAGAGARQKRRQARRHLGVRRDPLRDAHRRADVRGRHGHRRPRLRRTSGPRSQARAGKGPATARSAVSRRIRSGGCAMPATRCCCSTPHPAAHGRAATTSKTPLLALGGVAALLALGARRRVVRALPRDTACAEVVRFQMALPDDVNFTQFGVSTISPDGRKVAFAAYGYDGAPRVWIRTLDSPTARPLMEARTSQQQAPFFWSADSRYVFFDSERKLKKIDINGGPPEVLANLQPIGGSVRSDGTILFGAPGGIMKIAAEWRRADAGRQGHRRGREQERPRLSRVSAGRPALPLHARRTCGQTGDLSRRCGCRI